MRTIETIATIRPDGTLIAPVPPAVKPGEYRVVVVVDEQMSSADAIQNPSLSIPDQRPWPEGFSQNWEG